MIKLIGRVILFLLMALIISFVMIPAYEMLVGDQPFSQIKQDTIDNFNFESAGIWKRVFIFYLALWCGKAILWALATARIDPPA